MKKLLLAMSALAAVALLVPSSGVAGVNDSSGEGLNANIIGVYTTQTANDSDVSYTGTPGPVTCYAVVKNPVNYHTGAPGSTVESDITVLGGFEFKLVLPATVFLLSGTMPAGATNFLTPPNYLVGCNIPVSNRVATVVTFSLGWFSGTPEFLFVSPVDNVPSVNGKLAITDFNDDFRLNPAYPPYHDFAIPVFALGQALDSEDATWGGVKSLFR
ncbi:MAG TPA: hypothetical protein PLQ13_04335 [Candidatus Krumholzibacteria bacterium]|nr:hypothetical protein [Candidatus Krumholzibacteria bacterium]